MDPSKGIQPSQPNHLEEQKSEESSGTKLSEKGKKTTKKTANIFGDAIGGSESKTSVAQVLGNLKRDQKTIQLNPAGYKDPVQNIEAKVLGKLKEGQNPTEKNIKQNPEGYKAEKKIEQNPEGYKAVKEDISID